MKTGILFDLDGTLLDTLADLAPGGAIQAVLPGIYPAAPLALIAQKDVARELGFEANPRV